MVEEERYIGTCIRCNEHLYTGWAHCCWEEEDGIKVCTIREEYCGECKGYGDRWRVMAETEKKR